MKKIILMGGDLASGKSTYSNIIGEKYNILVINKDNLKEILGDTIIVNNRQENKKLSVISFDLICYLIKKNKGNIVIESNFKPYEMDVLEKLFKEYDYDVLSLVFKGDNEVLHKRFLDRLNENRHYVHKSQDFTNIEDFIKTLDELRSVKYAGKVINVDSTNFNYQKDDKLFKEIECFLNIN